MCYNEQDIGKQARHKGNRDGRTIGGDVRSKSVSGAVLRKKQERTNAMAEQTITYDRADCCLTDEAEATTEEVGRRFVHIPGAAEEQKKELPQEKIKQNEKTEKTAEPKLSAEIRKRNKFFFGCYLVLKRLFDIVFSAVILVAFSWLYLILALAVKCSDGGKVIYKHERVGKNGKKIYIAKFRSMKRRRQAG